MRLSAPTNQTFLLALGLLVVGIASYVGALGDLVAPDPAFWITAAGGGLLAVGALFRKI